MSGYPGRYGRSAIEIAMALAALPFVLPASYLGLLAVAAKRTGDESAVNDDQLIAILVPAHNEQAGLATTIRSLQATCYPAQRRRIMVVADNCDDDTATVAAASGAEVLVRDDKTKIGKGHALALGFLTLLADPLTDVVMVVDADTIVSPNVLQAVSGRISAGARVVQVRYGVSDPDTSWRTELMSLALACLHDLRSLGRERLKLSAGLHGNGMAFTRAALEATPYEAFSLTEDLEYAIELVLRGFRVWYVDEAAVYAEMPSTGDQAISQRQRWELGRAQLRGEKVRPLVRRAVLKRDRVAADAAAELLIRPLGDLTAALATGLLLSQSVSRVAKTSAVSPAMWLAGLLMLGGYVGRGWQLSAIGWNGIAALAHTPGYLVWKFRVRLRQAGAQEGNQWIRTQRSGE
jgi:1,2-diacylglycerol 3-beta-glucosyltransferase